MLHRTEAAQRIDKKCVFKRTPLSVEASEQRGHHPGMYDKQQVGKDTFFFPNGKQPYPFVSFSLSTAYCT